MARRNWLFVGVVVAGAACAFACFARAAPPAQFALLRADVAEWSIVPSVGVVPAGRVRITVRNLGAVKHSLLVVRTDRFGQELPMQNNRAVAHPVASPVLVDAGAVKSFIVSLPAGSYVLLDNLPGHYWKGTSVAIAVR